RRHASGGPPTRGSRGGSRSAPRRSGVHRDAVDEVRRIAEAAGGDAAMLLVVHDHPAAEGLADLLGDAIVADRELPEHRRHAWHGGHGELPLPGLAEPALARELLQHARAVA